MSLHSIYHRLNSVLLTQAVERIFVVFAIVAFVVHSALIFLAYNVPSFYAYQHVVSPGYFSALSTPFTVILYFEIFLLLLAIPQSLLRSVVVQYEIVSLILLRNVFKDISQVEVTLSSFFSFEILGKIIADMFGAVAIFFLVALIVRMSRDLEHSVLFHGSHMFVRIKQSFSAFLAIALVFSIAPLLFELFQLMIYPGAFNSFASFDFYKDFFTLLIFADILLLLISLIHTDDYGVVFLYAGFIVSTILIRLSFVAGGLLETGLSVVAVIFGVVLMYIYRRFYSTS